MLSPEPRGGHEAAGISRCSRRCGGCVAAAIHAQQAKPVIGFSERQVGRRVGVLRSPHFATGLSEAGYIEGRNLSVEYRWASGSLRPALRTRC